MHYPRFCGIDLTVTRVVGSGWESRGTDGGVSRSVSVAYGGAMRRHPVTKPLAVVAALLLLIGIVPAAAAGDHSPRTNRAVSVSILVTPAAEQPVTVGTVVEATFSEPLAAASARFGQVGRPARSLPVTPASDALSVAATITAAVLPGEAYRLTVRGTTAAGRPVMRVVTYYGAVSTRPARVGGIATHVLGGDTPVVGDRGRLVRFTLEVQQSLRGRMQDFAQGALRAINDTERGWSATGKYRLQRVTDPSTAKVRVLLARPPVVDRLCWQAGLNTAGRFSCWNGRFSAINLNRWISGGTGFASLGHYRTYVTNHEFGHGLGLGHRFCPRRGASSPVMQQQTSGQDGCRANGWPVRP
jgi:hypothetical protein